MAKPKKSPDPAADTLEVAQPAPSNTVSTLPLFALCLSELNVRRTERDADIAALAEDIAARGLKQNLVVTPAHFSTAETGGMEALSEAGANISPVDQYEVIAGGRRFQALSLLVADGRLPHDHPVPVMIEHRADARETSLSENLHRVAMNPADEFEAFAQIANQWLQRNAPLTVGMEPEATSAQSARREAENYVAKRFGVTQRHVAGRLRLAALAPEILEALREGKITLETAKAYASTADTERQSAVFKARAKQGPHYINEARGIRSELARNTEPADGHLATFVTLAAYVEAGGRTETDMFMGADGDMRCVNVPLLKQLVEARAAELIPDRAKADGFASGLFAWHHYSFDCPEGFIKTFEYRPGEAEEAERARSIAVYVIGQDGTLELETRLKPAEAVAPLPPRPDWRAEHAAQNRLEAIELKSAQLEVAALFDTAAPDPAQVIWPQGYGIDLLEAEDVEHLLVAVQIKVKRADAEARVDEATRMVDEEIAAAKAAEAEQRQAEAEEEEDEDSEFEDA